MPIKNSTNGHPNGHNKAGIPFAEIREPSETANSHRLADRLRGRAVYVYEAKAWYVFNGMCWVEDTDGFVRREAMKVGPAILPEAAEQTNMDKRQALVKWAKQSESQPRKDAMIKDASAVEGMTVPATIFDKDPYLLACKSGTVDLRTGELRDSKPEDYISRMSPYEFTGLDTPAPLWESFLSNIHSPREGDPRLPPDGRRLRYHRVV